MSTNVYITSCHEQITKDPRCIGGQGNHLQALGRALQELCSTKRRRHKSPQQVWESVTSPLPRGKKYAIYAPSRELPESPLSSSFEVGMVAQWGSRSGFCRRTRHAFDTWVFGSMATVVPNKPSCQSRARPEILQSSK